MSPASSREIEVSTEDEELSAGSEPEGDEEPAGAEPEPKQRNRYPASMGMSVLLSPGSSGDKVVATVSYAEYIAESYKESEGAKPRQVWRRIRREPVNVEVPLDPARITNGIPVPDTSGVFLRGKLGLAEGHGIPSGTRALSLFLVNERNPGERGRQDEQFLFQVQLELFFEAGFVPRPNRQGEKSKDWDDRVGDLQFR
ncbi:MAG: DISARM system helicase DrmA, partial [Vicinamibacteria bacterium]